MLVTNINSPSKHGIYKNNSIKKTNSFSAEKTVNFGRFDVPPKASVKVKISRILNQVLPWGKGRHVEEIIIGQEVIGNKYSKIDKEGNNILTSYNLKNSISEVTKIPADKMCSDTKKYENNKLKENLYKKGKYSLLTKYNEKGQVIEKTETLPDGSFWRRKFKNNQEIEMTQSNSKGGFVTETYSDYGKTKKLFIKNDDGSSIEQEFVYEKGNQIVAKSIEKDKKGNVILKENKKDKNPQDKVVKSDGIIEKMIETGLGEESFKLK